MSSTIVHTDASTKNCVFFIVGAKPGDQEYAEHISAAGATLKQISTPHSDFKYAQVVSAETGARFLEVIASFERFRRSCSEDVTLLISSPVKDTDYGHALFLSTTRTTGSFTETVFDQLCTWLSRNADQGNCQMNAIHFTSGGYCWNNNIDHLPPKSRLVSFDTDKEDTGSGFIAPLLEAAATTNFKADSWAKAASSIVQVGDIQRPLYRLLLRNGRIKSIIEERASTHQGQASRQVQVSDPGFNAQQGPASRPGPDLAILPAFTPLQSFGDELPKDWVGIVEGDYKDDVQSLSDSCKLADAGRG